MAGEVIVARVDGVSVDLLRPESDDVWKELREVGRRARPPITCACGGKMHPYERLYVFDGEAELLRMFRHNPGEAEQCRRLGWSIDESPEHHRLKKRIAAGAGRAGLKVEVEKVHDNGSRSDVYAVDVRTGKQFSFEAQLASLSLGDALARHENYLEAAERCTWFHSRMRDWSERIPSARVDDTTKCEHVIDGILDSAEQPVPPMTTAKAVEDIVKKRIVYVYDDFGDEHRRMGYYWDPRAGKAPPPKRKRKRVRQRKGPTRTCPLVPLTPAELAVWGAGIGSMHEFHTLLPAAHHWRAVYGIDALLPEHRRALELAGEYPELKTMATDRLAALNLKIED